MTEVRKVFVSKPNALSPEQTLFWEKLAALLRRRYLAPVVLGETRFVNCTPIEAVHTAITECQGAIVLGFRQIQITTGMEKAGTPKQRKLRNCFLPTAWNHIEAGMAFMHRLPVLILKEPGVSGGVFDAGITDRFVHEVEMTPKWFESEAFKQPFSDWFSQVLEREAPAAFTAIVKN